MALMPPKATCPLHPDFSVVGSSSPARRVLDTNFGTGLDFLTTWQAWRRDTSRPPMLHYVALTHCPTTLAELLACGKAQEDFTELVDELAMQWFGLVPGFHRLSLDGGRVLLTLCVGELTPMLRQQQFVADVVFIKTELSERHWDLWAVKALIRCCRRGTELIGTGLSSSLRSNLVQCGFALDMSPGQKALHGLQGDSDKTRTIRGQFNPHWVIKQNRSARFTQSETPNNFLAPGTCTVVGAGLAGAGVAASLARRGWQVTVLDAAATPAAGASGLPVGLMVPHVSSDDCTLSRLSRSGIRLTSQEAQKLLKKGVNWDACGTLERRFDGATGLTPNRTEGQDAWSYLASLEPKASEWLSAVHNDSVDDQTAIWHAKAGWLKPAELVAAWLAQPGITFRGKANVSDLYRDGKVWSVLDAQGHVLSQSDRVVIANAMGAVPLMASLQKSKLATQSLSTLRGIRGQLSWGLHEGLPDDVFPPFPVNGSGSLVPQVPGASGSAWFAGANYQADAQAPSLPSENHTENLSRLTKLLPQLGVALGPRFAQGEVNSWENTRCVTVDRMPLVGPLMTVVGDETQSSVWLCVGMGSRGITFSTLCAELLAAQWHGEPLPIEAGLADALDSRRHAQLPQRN